MKEKVNIQTCEVDCLFKYSNIMRDFDIIGISIETDELSKDKHLGSYLLNISDAHLKALSVLNTNTNFMFCMFKK